MGVPKTTLLSGLLLTNHWRDHSDFFDMINIDIKFCKLVWNPRLKSWSGGMQRPNQFWKSLYEIPTPKPYIFMFHMVRCIQQEGPWAQGRSTENDWSVEWNHLWNFGRLHHEEQFCEFMLNLGQWFRRRCCLKDLIWSSDSPPVWWSRTIYAILKEGIMGNTRVKLYGIWISCSEDVV